MKYTGCSVINGHALGEGIKGNTDLVIFQLRLTEAEWFSMKPTGALGRWEEHIEPPSVKSWPRSHPDICPPVPDTDLHDLNRQESPFFRLRIWIALEYSFSKNRDKILWSTSKHPNEKELIVIVVVNQTEKNSYEEGSNSLLISKHQNAFYGV